MTCPSCGSANPPGAKFCNECATRLNASCPSCGASNPPSAKFCSECATSLAASTLGDTAAPGERAASSSNAAGIPVAERRLVSVLFADLVGFTPFSEERDPEAVRETLTAYYDRARLAVERHGGTIEKFIGDAVMAVWGTPVAHEDDAERAVRAALEIVDSTRDLGSGIEARAGVLTGEAAVNLGAVGQGMVAGDLVNSAARLQAAAQPSAVLVGEATMRASEAAIGYEPIGALEVKGRSTPLEAWQARRVLAQRGGYGRTEALEAPFVGRDDELRLLKDTLHATGRDRRVRLVSITGPAGIGKSRLAWELEKYIDGVVEPIYWHRGRSPSYGDGVAFWALGEMVRRRAGLREGDDDETTRARITATLADYIEDPEDRAWAERAVLALLGLEPAPPGGRDVLFAGWRMFFEYVSRRGTAVLLFEDVQWADSGLLDFIDHLLEWSKGAPILVVTLARPELIERRSEWGAGKRHLTSVALEPLGHGAMRDLLGGLVPGLPESSVAAILARADGIPLYAVETVRMLLADGLLERSGNAYRPTGDLTRLAVPDTLRSLIGARLDALEPDDRRLIQDAAILGRTFSGPSLAEIAGTDETAVESRLRGLVRREILELEADPRSPERGQYGFVQSLIREVAYDTISRRDRRTRHLAAARYFESLDDPEIAGALASHYRWAHDASEPGPEAAALAGQARLALRAAADRAAALGGHQQAVGYLEEALDVTDTPADRAELLERAATSADSMTDYAAAERFATRAAEEFRTAGDSLGAARATALLGWSVINAGDVKRASKLLAAAHAELPESERGTEIEVILLVHLSRAAFRGGEMAKAAEFADRALALAEPRNDEALIAEAFINKGSSYDFEGRRREAVSLYEAALRIARSKGLIASELRAINNLAGGTWGEDPAAALEVIRSGVELAARVGNRGMGAWLVGTYGYFAYGPGVDWPGMVAILEAELTQNRAPGDRLRLVSLLVQYGAAMGVDVSARQAELVDLEQGITDPQLLSGAQIARAEAALAAGDVETAEAAGRRTSEIFADYGYWGLQAITRVAIARRDGASARSARDGIRALGYGDRATSALRAWADAVVVALDGRTDEANAAFRSVLAEQRALGFAFEIGRTAIDLVRLFGLDDPFVRQAADEARPLLERIGARAWTARLEEAIAAAEERDPHSRGRAAGVDGEVSPLGRA
jgi:class 3 adenylate cyclase/tetratricopeptide (TPR) repeat protein